jgi:Cof subfamily protein (haloacid dehalogenase superfamily)
MSSNVSLAEEKKLVAMLADIDGTLLTKDKVLTPKTIEAVHRLRQRGIAFCVTSGRPPAGMRMFVEPLELTVAMAAFNGGIIVRTDLTEVDRKALPPEVVPEVIKTIRAHHLDAWVFGPKEWYVTDPQGTRVERETSNLKLPPVVVPNLDQVLGEAIKVVGVSMDYDAVARCEAALQAKFGDRITAARSQPHYLDVTHPEANKGAVVERLARFLGVSPDRIVTIGDQPNDVLMFKRSGLSIAMGNASPEVQRQATFVTASYGDEGFARAVDRLLELPSAA